MIHQKKVKNDVETIKSNIKLNDLKQTRYEKNDKLRCYLFIITNIGALINFDQMKDELSITKICKTYSL